MSDGLARLYDEKEVKGTDRLLRRIYDALPSVHDPLVELTFPWLQSESEVASRDRYVKRLALSDLKARPPEDGPVRVLEIGIGTGANVPLVRRALPSGLDAEIWGVDLSAGMLAELNTKLRVTPKHNVRTLMADAHRLPFPDHCFDRVFQVGAINGFRDPRKALAEMARVAMPDTPIVVVDEQLDPSVHHGILRQAAFKFFTYYDPNPHSPIELLPASAEVIADEQAGPFFFCLAFRVRAT